MLVYTLLILYAKSALAILGYDCGGSGLNITTLSLLDTGDCEQPSEKPRATEVYIQLLQLSEYDHTQVFQCRIEIDRTIYYCGMHSHTSAVHNGRRIYLMDIPEGPCRVAHNTGILGLTPSLHLTGLRPNSTEYRSATLAGSTSTNGDCSGTQYSDPYGTWDNVVVQASVKIQLANYQSAVKINENHVRLRSGITCTFSDGSCITDEDGNAFWEVVPKSNCDFHHYDVLYEGLATKLKTDNAPEIYTIIAQDITFALERRFEHLLCGYTLLRTEHPKLFILETVKGRTFTSKKRIAVDNLDIFAYMNSKFIYVEKHIRTQMDSLYQDVVSQKCELEKQVLKNALAFASLLPDVFAYTIMKSPGYMAVTAGEVVHVIKCTPVPVKIRHTEECYVELPVYQQNASMFLTPKSRVLIKSGTIKECNSLLPAMFSIDKSWYRFTPKPSEVLAPQVLQPMTRPTWKYMEAGSLATSGIYSQSDLDNLRDHIMFPAERPALLNTIARGAAGQRVPIDSVSLYNLLNEADLHKITEDAASKIWQGFLTFGSASAGLIGIFLVVKAIKLCVDALIRGYALHTIYGWSIHLLGAIWSSITHLLLHLGRNRTTPEDPPKTEEKAPEQRSSAPEPVTRTFVERENPVAVHNTRYPILESLQAASKMQPQENLHFQRLT